MKSIFLPFFASSSNTVDLKSGRDIVISISTIQRCYSIYELAEGGRVIKFGSDWRVKSVVKKYVLKNMERLQKELRKEQKVLAYTYPRLMDAVDKWVNENYETLERAFDLSKVLGQRSLEVLLPPEKRTIHI